MSIEPERPIEKRLRAVAQKRREEAGNSFDLHPVNRRLLHDEIARKYPKGVSERRSLFGISATLWPRLAVGLAAIMLLAFGSWHFFAPVHHEKPNTLLAKNEVQHNAPAAQPIASAEPGVAPNGQLRDELAQLDSKKTSANLKQDEPVPLSMERAQEADRSAEADKQLAKESVDVKTPVASAAPAKDQSLASSSQAAAPKASAEASFARRYGLASPSSRTDSSSLAAAAGTSPASTSPTPVNAGQTMLSFNGNPSQQEVAAQLVSAHALSEAWPASPRTNSMLRVYFTSVGNSLGGANGRSLTEEGTKLKSEFAERTSFLKTILPSFQVEQSGPTLRVIDQDGSIYSGYLQASPMPVMASKIADTEAGKQVALAQSFRQGTESRALSTPANSPVSPQTYYFNVVGTNRSLNKSVVFSGSLLGLTNSPGFTLNSNTVDGNGTPAAPPASIIQNVAQPFLRISGKAVVGQKDELQIEAVPAPRQSDK
jgi:hypothetical protein